MAVRTSAITYNRGIPKTATNFFFVAQANNTVIHPFGVYFRTYQYRNRNIINRNINGRWPWSH
jgi:hypothetical protein